MDEEKYVMNQVNAFVKSYYARMNGKFRNLEKLYDERCVMTWPDSAGNIITQDSNSHINLFFAEDSVRPQYEVTSFIVQPCPNGHLLLVHGIRDDDKTFVQTLLLRNKSGKLLVMNDILVVKAVSNMDQTDLPVKDDQKAAASTSTLNVCCPTAEDDNRTDASSTKVPEMSTSEQDIKVCIVTSNQMTGHQAEYYCTRRGRRMLRHKAKLIYDEVPGRLTSIMTRLEQDKVLQRVEQLEPSLADYSDLCRVHEKEYLDFIGELPLTSKASLDKYKELYNPDMFCSGETRTAAFLAAGAVVKACEVVAEGKFQKAFAIVRPPGHHASEKYAEGFCFLNNIAIGADFLIKHLLYERVLVVDFDVHHGNGTQKIFYRRKDVLFFSTFCSAIDYPPNEEKDIGDLGDELGLGYNINVPLKKAFGDADMLLVWRELLIPILEEYDPQIILISAGYDAAAGDHVGKCCLTSNCYGSLLNMLGNHANGKMVLALEGGYNLDVLAECTSYSIRSMLGDDDVLLDPAKSFEPDVETVNTVKKLKNSLKEYWNVFKEAENQT